MDKNVRHCQEDKQKGKAFITLLVSCLMGDLVFQYNGLLTKNSVLCRLPISLNVIFVIGIVVNYIEDLN